MYRSIRADDKILKIIPGAFYSKNDNTSRGRHPKFHALIELMKGRNTT